MGADGHHCGDLTMATGMFSGGAAFGVFPQMQPRRRFQDPEASANVPLDVTRGRFAGLAGLLPDALNFMGRSPMPTEMFGETQYEPTQQLPYGSEYYLQNLPLKPTSRIGEVAGQAGAFVPLNPMPAARAVAAGAKALGPTAVGMGERYLQSKGLMPSVVEGESIGMLGGPIKPQAPVSELGFYSATEQAALNLPRKSGTGESFLNDLMKGQDVKKDELSWLGLDDYLKGKPNVTRQEVQDFIANNRVDVRERQLGAAVAEDPVGIASRQAVFDKYEPEIQALYKEIDQYETNTINARNLASKNETEAIAALNREGNPQPIPTTDDWNRYYAAKAEMERVNKIPLDSREYVRKLDELVRARDAEANSAYVIPESTPTNFKQYQLPGGENYREILLTLPANASKAEQTYMRLGDLTRPLTATEQLEYGNARAALLKETTEGSKTYRSSHFDQPNILAHMRVNDRVDADGKKMLLIEEIQSDWHQAGREKGYAPKDAESQLALSRDRMAERGNEIRRISSRMEALNDSQLDEFNMLAKERQNLQDLQGQEMDWGNKLLDAKSEGVPDAPFKDTWHQLALKRALKYAADNGYDRVGLTTGRQQVDRYANQIRQNVDEIQFQTGQKLTDSQANELQLLRNKARDEGLSKLNGTERQRYDNLLNNEGEYVGKNQTKIKAFKGSDSTFSGIVKDGKFLDGPAAGKTVTEVLGKSMAKKIAEQRTGTIKGDDLTIGGEGMKAYYDEIYPAFLAKQGKKYNAKTGETRIKTGKNLQDEDFVPAQTRISEALGDYGERGYKTTDNRFFDTYADAVSHEKKISSKDLFDATIRYIDISPEMRGGVKKGQPLFTAAPIGGIGLGAGTQDNEMPDAVRQYMADLRYSDPFADTTR